MTNNEEVAHMIGRKFKSVCSCCFAVIGLAALLLLTACGAKSERPQGTATTQKASIQHLATAPAVGKVGMVYFNTTDNREYIFDGSGWVPHDKSIDTYYPAADSKTVASLDPCTEYACNPGGAHKKHSSYNCSSCHMMHGPTRFDPNGPAVIQPTATNPNPLKPAFEASDNTCSNIACHAVPTGTFSYYFPGGDGESYLTTVTYGSAATGATSPSWYALPGTGACNACHGNPPKNGSNGSNVWHSGYHANQGPTGAANQCQFCHPDAVSTNGQATAITNPALHSNGVVNVQVRFKSSCFGCH